MAETEFCATAMIKIIQNPIFTDMWVNCKYWHGVIRIISDRYNTLTSAFIYDTVCLIGVTSSASVSPHFVTEWVLIWMIAFPMDVIA